MSEQRREQMDAMRRALAARERRKSRLFIALAVLVGLGIIVIALVGS